MRGTAIAVEVEEWFTARLGAPLPEPKGRSQKGPKLDAADMMVRSPPPDAVDLSGLAVRIVYLDAAGAASERTIRCSRAWVATYGAVLTGFCLLRLEPRSFRIDRIREVIDLETGEVDDGPTFFANAGLTNERGAVQHYLEAVRRGLKVVMAMAAADGVVFNDEIEAVARWADHLADLHGIALDDALLSRVLKVARAMRPDAETAIGGLRAALANPAEARLLARALRDIMHADDHVDRRELRLVEQLTAALRGEAM